MSEDRRRVIVRCGVMGAAALGFSTLPEIGGLGLLVAAVCWAGGLYVWWDAG